MKIRHPFLIRLVAFFVSWLIRAWVGTLCYQHRSLGSQSYRPGRRERYIYAFWHENLLLLAYHYGRRDIQVLISQHADGELIAQACQFLGFGTIRGSRTRGGTEAMRQLVRAGDRCHLAVVPDGPRGPRRSLPLGPLYLASRTGLPIVAVGIGYERPWRTRSWDRFALPRPWTRACTVTHVPIFVPPDLDKDQLEPYRQKVAEAMRQANDIAEAWAETGRWPRRMTAPAEAAAPAARPPVAA
jgi:lysophospholipid acyltransferase (LPLAT)-like uncharacterized protein